MRYHRAWAAGLLIAAVVLGCGPAKELPDETPATTERGQDSGTAPESIPARSDPAAVEIVDRAIKAHTQNNPSLLAKGKVSRQTATGTIKLNTGMVPVMRTLVARWPNDIKASFAFKPPQSGTLTYILNAPYTWKGINGVQEPNLDPRKIEDDMRTDGYGMHWLVLLFPLVENNVVIFDARKGVGAGSPAADVVKVSIPGRPIYRLHVAPNTGFLTAVDYHFTDMLGVPALTEWMLSDHKFSDGLLLPTKLTMARTTDRPKYRDVVQELTVESWEFPGMLPDEAFSPPK